MRNVCINLDKPVTAPSMSPAVRVSHAEHDQRGLVTCVPPPNARTSIMNSYQ